MATIDFSLIENWLKNHGGKSFKRGELDGSPAREMYKTFVQTIIEGSDFEADYSAWQNSGHTLTYFWAKIRNKAPQKKNSFLGIAMSAQIVNGELEILMRLEAEDKKIQKLSLVERKKVNKCLVQHIPDSRCYYDSNIDGKVYTYEKAIVAIEDGNHYVGRKPFKIRPNIKLTPPFTAARTSDIIGEAKGVFKIFKEAYEKMFIDETDEAYWPSLNEFDPGLSKDQWKKYITEEELPTQHRAMQMLKAMKELGGEASCKQLSEKYGGTPTSYVGAVVGLGKRIKKYFNLPSCMDNDQERYFPFAFQGKYRGGSEDNYIYRMRPELLEALKEIDMPQISPQYEDTEKIKEAERMPCGMNTILYGPPGTGKTYHTVLYAVSIIEGVEISELETQKYSDVFKRYCDYKANGQIEFTTFHQSYGYEEFIEGIKPDVTDDGQMTYKVLPGVFKRFCDKACTPKLEKMKTNSAPVVWKVSLAKAGDNPIRTECLDEGHIRLGWDEYGEAITEDTDYKNGGKSSLNAFISEMREGDIVVSCYRADTADAIGIVTGAYSWNSEYPEYKRVRTVEWIVKGNFNITAINGGKNMSQSAVHRLNDIDLDKLYAYMASASKFIEENKDKYVFIIDEINRGNVSKILGEAITLLEPSKRKGADEEIQVTLPYSGKKFGVPKNVYIIGTMNTADRSIALMDTALRRRFNFVEMMPNPELFKGIDIEGVSIKHLLETINNRIHYLYDREHTIGHAYFKDLLYAENKNIQTLRAILKNNVLPLLQEYFYDDYDKIAQILGDADKKIFFKEISAAGIAFDGETKYELDYAKLEKISVEEIKKIYQ